MSPDGPASGLEGVASGTGRLLPADESSTPGAAQVSIRTRTPKSTTQRLVIEAEVDGRPVELVLDRLPTDTSQMFVRTSGVRHE